MIRDQYELLKTTWSNRLSKPWPRIQTARIPAEQKKVIIETSLGIALRRCGVHILPILFSIVIVTLNLKGYYIGQNFQSLIQSETLNIGLLQIAAKAQEILIVASLTTIILHMIRRELLYGDGLAFGLIGSALAFSNIDYFFSKEFIGSLSYRSPALRKTVILLCLILAGIIAALAGPSCAVLLVPENRTWPAGGTKFYLNGSKDDFWPLVLSYDTHGGQRYCGSENATSYGICPSGGFRSLWAHYGQANSSNFQTSASRPYAKKLSGSSYYWTIDSPLSQIPPLYSLGSSRTEHTVAAGSFLIQPHASTTAILQQLTTDWWSALLSQTHRSTDTIDDRIISTTVQSPITGARCAEAQNLSAPDDIVHFPSLVGNPSQWADAIDFPVDGINNAGAASNHLRFKWVHLPMEFGPATVGAVFESPWSSDNKTRVVIGCTLQSAWIPSTIYSDEYTFWSGWYPWNLKFEERYPPYVPPPGNISREIPQEANGRIAVKDSWLDILTPSTPPEGPGYYPWRPSTIESILVNSGIADGLDLNHDSESATDQWTREDLSTGGRTVLLESIVCSVLEDGLARVGSYRIYNSTGTVSDWTLAMYDRKPDFDTAILRGRQALERPDIPSSNITELKAEMAISGYAYKGSTIKYLAMIILFAHMCFALCHITWTLWTKQTSNSWISVTEIIALAQNSRPALKALGNSAAGIDHYRTYAQKAKILTSKLPGHDEADHVEIVVGDDPEAAQNDYHGEEEEMESRTTRTQLSTTPLQRAHSAEREENRISTCGETDVGLSLRSRSREPSTWPRYRPDSSLHSDSSSMHGALGFRASSPTAPLLVSRPGGKSRLVQVDHSYG